MRTLRIGVEGLDVLEMERLLVKRGYAPVLEALGDKNDPGVFDENTEAAVKQFQRTHCGPDGRPLKVDGIVGTDTWWALRNESRFLPAESESISMFIPMKAVELPFYGDNRVHKFWLNIRVADSFMMGIKEWQNRTGGVYIVTGTYRSVAAQVAAKKAKPGLCAAPGWSLHAHGRAVDGHIRPENPALLVRFYEHMQAFGWYTIFNFPDKPVIFKSRESWHIQNTADVTLETKSGMRSKEYLRKWASQNGGESALLRVQKKEVR